MQWYRLGLASSKIDQSLLGEIQVLEVV